MLTNPSLFRINVGFIVNQSIGYNRNFSIEIPELYYLDDLAVQNLEGNIVISRTTEGLLVQVKGQAQTELECVYCLDRFEQNLQLDFVEMYTFPSHADKDTELILPDDLQINLAPLIREYLFLDIPINPACKPDCKGLCPICGESLSDSACDHDDEAGDPRLSVLKTLLDDEASDAM
jgi:uncharacterized protein